MKNTIKIPIGLLLAPVVGYLAALATEAVTGTFVSFKVLMIMAIVAIAVVVALHFLIKLPRFWAGAIVFGILISPYIQFIGGKINIFLTDPPKLRPSVSVPEIRIEMGDLIFINSEDKEVVVLPASGVKTLYPGKNIVNLGSLNIPAGTYKSGRMSMKNIEVDVNVDLKKEADLVYAQFEKMFKPEIPTDMPPEALAQIPTEADIKARVAAGMAEYIKPGVIASFLPPFIKIKSFNNTGDKLNMVLSAQIDLPPLPIAFPYPTGTGGPDIVLDITLNEIGLPTGITPIIKLPPGAPAINIPDMTPKIGEINMPTDFGVPQAVLDQIKAQIDAGVKKGEEIKKQMETKQ